MIRCLIVDDEPFAVNLLETYVRQTPFLQLAGKCYNALEALEFLRDHPVDLLFLDINMPRLSGMQLATLVHKETAVIFTTAYSEYAVGSYELGAVDYLLKPITFERFVRAVQKIAPGGQPESEPAPENTGGAFFVKTGKAVVQLAPDDIRYIEGCGDYALFHLPGERHAVYQRLKALETQLPPQFCRIHNSYIVNLRHVQRIEDQQVFVGEKGLPLSEKYREGFWEKVERRLLK